MVLPLHTLPADVQELFARLLADATTAGRLAQASRACQQLLLQRLIDLCEERRLAAQAQMEARRQRKRAAVIQCFEAIDGAGFLPLQGPRRTTCLFIARYVGSRFVSHAAAHSRCSCRTCSTSIRLSTVRSCSHSSICECCGFGRATRRDNSRIFVRAGGCDVCMLVYACSPEPRILPSIREHLTKNPDQDLESSESRIIYTLRAAWQ